MRAVRSCMNAAAVLFLGVLGSTSASDVLLAVAGVQHEEGASLSLMQVRAGITVSDGVKASPAMGSSPAAAANSAPSAALDTQPLAGPALDGKVGIKELLSRMEAEATAKSAQLYRSFGNCVEFATKSWQESPTCPRVGAQSQDELCSWWLEENCIVDAKAQCDSVNTMCSLQRRSFVSTGLLPSVKRALMFMHIPKNGGTSIEEAAFDNGIMWGRHFMGGLVTMPGNKPCSKYHVPPTYLPDAGAYQDTEVFCVTRHPYQRIVSEYIYLLRMSWGSHFSPGLYDLPACSAEGLNNFVMLEMQNLEKTSFGLDCHMVPQTEYIFGPSGEKYCQHILKFDELPGAFNDLMTTMEYPVELKETLFINTRGNQCPSLSTKDLSEEAKLMLNKIYFRDFESLGFDP